MAEFSFKNIFLVGVGATAYSVEKAQELVNDLVKKGDLIAKVDDAPVYATLDGVLRGILRDGLPVPEHFKIADIDPRLSERENCFTISDKARAIAGGVLQAICIYENGLCRGEGRK